MLLVNMLFALDYVHAWRHNGMVGRFELTDIYRSL